jgi:hypothetical protein
VRQRDGDDPVKGEAGMTSRRRIAAIGAIIGFAVLSGCGSGGGAGAPSSPVGSMTVRVVWPPASGTRMIPAAANSIALTVTRNSNVLTTKIVARPPAGGVSTIKIDQIPACDVVVDATANPDAAGTGVAQASGQTNVKIERDKDTKFTITMDSTIDRVEVTSASGATVAVGATLQLTATPKDAQGSTVLVVPGSIQWDTSDHAVATVDATGAVSGAKSGTVTVTATEPESGKAGQMGVAVGGTLYVLCVSGSFYQGERFYMTNADADFYLNGTLFYTTTKDTPHDGYWMGPGLYANKGDTVRVAVTAREVGQHLEFGTLSIGITDSHGRLVKHEPVMTGWYDSPDGVGLDFSFSVPF